VYNYNIEHYFDGVLGEEENKRLCDYNFISLKVLDDSKEEIGSIKASFFKPNQINFDIIDDIDPIEYDAYEEILKLIKKHEPLHLIYIRRININKNIRGIGLGSKMLDHFLNHCEEFFQFSLIFLQSVPQDCDEENKNSENYNIMQKRLNNFYKKNYFKIKKFKESETYLGIYDYSG
jgi:GNAT superfamily N-acetyltransferase